jgi:UDP-glucuronate 4-epimerase
MATYLVTGCAGFIGSKVAELLTARGDAVLGIDNLNDAYDVRLKDWRLSQLASLERFTFEEADISDYEGLVPFFESNDLAGVINLAARAGVRRSTEIPEVYVQTNTQGALNLLKLASEWNVKKYILASTSSLYGSDNRPPFHEGQNTDRPLSPYAASKKGAEAMAHAYHHLFGLDVVVVRYFTVYGPAGRPDMSLFRFVQWIYEDRPLVLWGDGNQSRDFTYVDDIAAGTIAALDVEGSEIINLGAHREVVLMDVIHMIEGFIGKKARIEFHPSHPADMKSTLADVTKASELLGWKAKVPLEEGLQRLVAWYEDNREWAREVDTTG